MLRWIRRWATGKAETAGEQKGANDDRGRPYFEIRALATGALLTVSLAAAPATAADFYAGKQVQMRIGAAAGGGYDFYGRMVARHIGRHIPGHPTIVPSNMPAASSRALAAYLFSVASKDGTEIGAISPNAILGPLIDANFRNRYDPRKFEYIGTADTGLRVCITWGPSQTKSLIESRRDAIGLRSPAGRWLVRHGRSETAGRPSPAPTWS